MQILKEEVRITILVSARKLFTERGYLRTTLKDIAIESHISKSNIYNYFKTKEELLDELTFACKCNLNTIMNFLQNNRFEGADNLKNALLNIIFQYIIPEREGMIILYEKELEDLEKPYVSSLLKIINSMVVPDLTIEENKQVIHIIVENLVKGYIDILKSTEDKSEIEYRMLVLTEYHIGGLANMKKLNFVGDS